MDKFARFAPIVLFCLFFTKVGVNGSSYTDAAVLAVGSLLIIANELKLKNKDVVNLQDKLKILSEDILEQKKEIESLKTYVSSQKMNALRVKSPHIG